MHVDRQIKNNFKVAGELPCNDIYKAPRFVIAWDQLSSEQVGVILTF